MTDDARARVFFVHVNRTSWCRAWHLALTTVVPLGFAAVVISQTVDASTVDFPLSTVVAALSHHAPK